MSLHYAFLKLLSILALPSKCSLDEDAWKQCIKCLLLVGSAFISNATENPFLPNGAKSYRNSQNGGLIQPRLAQGWAT